MFQYSKIIKLFEIKNVSPYRVSKDTGISQSSFSDWKNGKSKPSVENLNILAKYFDVSIDYLTGVTSEQTKAPEIKAHIVHAPLYARLSCGLGGFVDDDIIEYISLPDTILNPNKEYFAQYASGDSMMYANIHDGDLLVFEKTNILENNQIGCFCIDENYATCKKFYKTGQGIIMLQPANDKYDPIVVEIENQCFKILGKLALTINKR